MKKINKFLSIFALAAVLFTSCEVGLGPAVDMEPPVVTLTSHKDNDSVASTFRLVGTASDNEGVTKLKVDFEDKNIHFYVTGDGIWHKKTSASEWTVVDTERASVSFDGKTMNWWVEVDTTDSSEAGNTFAFSIVAEDELGNTGKESKINCSLFIDENLPQASIIKPELGVRYSEIRSSFDSYTLNNANIIKYLKNGDLNITGRLDGAISSKELFLQFDDGTTSRTITGYGDETITSEDIARENPFDATKVYLSKSLKVGDNGIADLRAWELTVNQSEWVTDSLNPELKTGKHLIRVVATSISSAFAYERKVLGWFTWWPEADTPWITINGLNGNPSEVYPSSNITGEAYDDDGIRSLTYIITKDNSNETPVSGTLTLSEENATSSSWAVRAPTDRGDYSIQITVTDLNNKHADVSRSFRVLDVQPPAITISSPANHASIVADTVAASVADSAGNVTFSGTLVDDGLIDSFDVIYLHPIANSEASNIVRYMSGEESFWESADTESEEFTCTQTPNTGKRYKNKKFRISGSELTGPTAVTDDKGKNWNSYSFTKKLNLFTDLGITADGTKPLTDQYFVFRAKDSGGTSTVEQMYLKGDTKLPSLTLETVKVNSGEARNYADIVSLPKISSSTDTITLTGAWSDNSASLFGKNRINSITVNYSGISKTYAVTMNDNGSWTSVLSAPAPSSSGVITIKLKDYAGNETKLEKSLVIDSENAGIARVGCENDDGTYSHIKNDKLNITIEFNKSTDVIYTTGSEPQLTLSSGGSAVYKSGSGTTKHIYEYTIGANDTNGKLTVTGITANGAVWRDKNNQEAVEVTTQKLADATNLSSRNIFVDNTAPSISRILIMNNADKPYKQNDNILLMLEFSENVTIVNDDKLQLTFKNEKAGRTVTTTSAARSGTKYVLFVYTVGANDNFDELQFDSIKATSGTVTVTDDVNNSYTIGTSAQTLSITPDKTIVIDTTSPVIPTINRSTDWPTGVVLDELTDSNKDDIYFTITGTETGATVKYTLDGSNYLTYTAGSNIYLRNNGNYTVKAYQTDTAGNSSATGVAPENTGSYSVTIDRGPLLKRITTNTFSGTYKAETSITGTIEFRKPVVIPAGSEVTLNVANGSATPKTSTISGAGGSAASSYSFTYTISEGDKINSTTYSDELLDVISLGFTSVTLDGKTVPVTLPGINDEARFKKQRDIKILTGKPEKSTLTFSGEGTAAVLTVTYNRPISKNSTAGDITFTMAEDDFKIPVVLSEAEYSELPSGIQTYYEAGVNGAAQTGSGNTATLTNDTTTKYILPYDTNDTTIAAIKALYIAANKHKVTIPMYSSAVRASGSTLTVTLGSQYALPVKGAAYTLNIPAGAVQDTVGNTSALLSQTVTADGIEKPVIRIKKSAYSIGGITSETSGDYTKTATVTMPQTAEFRIDCRTPGATITYKTDTKAQTAVSVIEANHMYETKTTNNLPSIPAEAAITTSYTANQKITIGSGNDYKVDSYANAAGLKISIAAKSAKTVSGVAKTAVSYEYAARTVLKFKIDGNYSGDGAGTKTDSDMPTGTTFKDLRVWVAGGDSPYGANSVKGFPLSWDDSSNFKLMAGAHTANQANDNMFGEWWWVSWDIAAPTYHGFYIGDVPYDVKTKGPYVWFAAECGWVPTKENYVLYPGETLVMYVTAGNNNGPAYLFRPKNKAKRTRSSTE